MQYVKELFLSYFASLVYPFRIHDYFRFRIPLPEPEWAYPRELSIFEAICVSWVFELIKAILQVMLINLTLVGVSHYSQEANSILQSFSFNSAFAGHSLFLIALGLRAAVFPVLSLVVYEFWSIVLRGMANLLDIPERAHEMAERIIVSSQSSHAFSVIPIIGELAQKISSFFLMYAGIRKHLQASPLLTIFILLSPLFLLLTFLGLFLACIFLFIA